MPLKRGPANRSAPLMRDCRARSTHAIDSRNDRPRPTQSTSAPTASPRRPKLSMSWAGAGSIYARPSVSWKPAPRRSSFAVRFRALGALAPPRGAQRLFFKRFNDLKRAHQSALRIPSPTSVLFQLTMEPNVMSNPDDDPSFDIDPDGDAAAYEEWAALAGEPARPAPHHPQRDFADSALLLTRSPPA
jgi:hypothetical protein